MPPFEKFVNNSYKGRLITLDPGETTGYSIWDNQKLVECSQLNTYQVQACVGWLNEWIDIQSKHFKIPDVYVVMEEYRVYAHKTQDHAQDNMHTSRLIGALECMFTLRGIRYEMQGASMAKKFCTDEKLKAWGFWARGERHARDAIRHGVYFYCHGKDPSTGPN